MIGSLLSLPFVEKRDISTSKQPRSPNHHSVQLANPTYIRTGVTGRRAVTGSYAIFFGISFVRDYFHIPAITLTDASWLRFDQETATHFSPTMNT